MPQFVRRELSILRFSVAKSHQPYFDITELDIFCIGGVIRGLSMVSRSTLGTFVPKPLAIRIVNSFREGRIKYGIRSLGFKMFGHIPYRSLANPGDTVVQGGCWRTETVTQWSDIVGSDGHVVVIEGNPMNADILQLEKNRRELENVTVVRRAIWKESEEVTLQIKDTSKENKVREARTYSPSHPDESYDETVTVPSERIDSILEDVDEPSPDHIHLTVSGAEMEALQGMTQTLDRQGVRIFVRSILPRANDDELIWPEVIDFLEKYGFRTTFGQPPTQKKPGGNIYGAKL